MIKVSDVTLDLIRKDEISLEALYAGILNYSAYAKKIQKEVERLSLKPVKIGTIVVALSRMASNLSPLESLKPDIVLTHLSVRSSIAALTFDKTLDVQRRIAALNPFLITASELLAVVEGLAEVSLICSKDSKEMIVEHIGIESKEEQDSLVAVTVGFSKEFSSNPNYLYALLGILAAKRIYVHEIISTATQVTFIIEEKNMEKAMQACNVYFVGKEGKLHG